MALSNAEIDNINRLARRLAFEVGPALQKAHAELRRTTSRLALPTREMMLELLVERWERYCRQQSERAVAGVRARREQRATQEAVFRARVTALRARYPDHPTRAIANLALPRDERGDSRAIERMAARIRRRRL